MKLVKLIGIAPQPGEKTLQLKDVEVGHYFRYASIPHELAENSPGQNIHKKIKPIGAEKAKRVTVVSLDGLHLEERDEDHRVVPYSNLTIAIGNPDMASVDGTKVVEDESERR